MQLMSIVRGGVSGIITRSHLSAVSLEFVQADKSLLHVNHFNETTCQCGRSDLKFIQSQDSQTDLLYSRHSGSSGYPVTAFTLVMS